MLQEPKSEYMAKMVNATFAYQKTGGVNILVNDLHLPCLPHVYS